MPFAVKMGIANRVSGFGHFFEWVFGCRDLRFPENLEFQERFRVQIVRFTLAVGALPDVLDDVLRDRQQVQFRQHLWISAQQETPEASVVLQLSETAFCLNRAIDAQKLAFIRRDPV